MRVLCDAADTSACGCMGMEGGRSGAWVECIRLLRTVKILVDLYTTRHGISHTGTGLHRRTARCRTGQVARDGRFAWGTAAARPSTCERELGPSSSSSLPPTPSSSRAAVAVPPFAASVRAAVVAQSGVSSSVTGSSSSCQRSCAAYRTVRSADKGTRSIVGHTAANAFINLLASVCAHAHGRVSERTCARFIRACVASSVSVT